MYVYAYGLSTSQPAYEKAGLKVKKNEEEEEKRFYSLIIKGLGKCRKKQLYRMID